MNPHTLLTRLVLLVLPVTAWAESSFQRVILDGSYIAYERDVGDIDGDGDSDVVAVQEGDTTLQVFRAPNWTRSTLVTFSGSHRYPRADDLKLADIDGDGDLDVVTRLGAGASDDGAGVAVWCENRGQGTDFTQHLVGTSLEYVKDIVVADFDLDGDVDLLVGGMVQSQHRGLRLMLNAGKGSNWTPMVIQTEGSYSAELGDIDKDGDLDIVGIRNWNSAPTWICRNTVRGPSRGPPSRPR